MNFRHVHDVCVNATARPTPYSTTGTRSAFTLMETILALGLSALLLTGIYAAIDQSWRLTSSGREEMQRAQLARALIQKIELDVRAINYVPPTPYDETAAAVAAANAQSASSSSSSSSSGSSGGSSSSSSGGGSSGGGGGSSSSGSSGNSSGSGSGGGSSGSSGSSNSSSGSSSSGSSSSSSSSSTTSTTPTDGEVPVPNSKPIGLRGTNVQIEMSISRPRRDLMSIISTNTSAMTSDLRDVTYSFIPPGGANSGLIRTEGDRMAVEVTESSGGLPMQVSAIQVVASEVAMLQFRYFDGHSWYAMWDSDSVSRLPRAIEVTVAFPPPQRKPSSFNIAVSHANEVFRSVILIPVADPYPKEVAP